mmetsp:Transcript_18958/g.21781  ORF Transcript_18958/g.21781 Transcript_18958/m.21781 type:complete len:96 (-) Transcript_18958:463-750(-)
MLRGKKSSLRRKRSQRASNERVEAYVGEEELGEYEEGEEEEEEKETAEVNDNGDPGKERIQEFIESQKRISQIKSVMNEKEVRLMEIEGKSKKSK